MQKGVFRYFSSQRNNDDLAVERQKQMDLKVNLLQDSLNSIRSATASLKNASTVLNDNALCPQGKKMLVPHTTFLYVAGTLDDADIILVDVVSAQEVAVKESSCQILKSIGDNFVLHKIKFDGLSFAKKPKKKQGKTSSATRKTCLIMK